MHIYTKLTIDCMVCIVCTGFKRRTEKVEIDFVLLISTKGSKTNHCDLAVSDHVI